MYFMRNFLKIFEFDVFFVSLCAKDILIIPEGELNEDKSGRNRGDGYLL